MPSTDTPSSLTAEIDGLLSERAEAIESHERRIRDIDLRVSDARERRAALAGGLDLGMVEVAVAPRSGIEADEVERVVRGVAPDARVTFFEMPRVDITATLIRERIESDSPFEQLVPQRVSALIREEGYYRG